MEYFAGDALTPSYDMYGPVCEGPGATTPKKALSEYTKSRLIVAKEILTGTYEDYWCRERAPGHGYNGGLPLYEACSGYGPNACTSPRQRFDGLLDIARDNVKFTVMSFDTNTNPAGTWKGMYSYGPDKGGVNLGIRNSKWGEPDIANVWDESTGIWTVNDDTGHRQNNNRGQLITPSTDDGFGPMRNRNRLAQYDIASLRGDFETGGTPLGPALDDARWFLMSDKSVIPSQFSDGSGDALASCRDRTIILLTDGKASNDGKFGYPTTAAAIEAMKSTPPSPVRVVVVGFNLEGEAAARTARATSALSRSSTPRTVDWPTPSTSRPTPAVWRRPWPARSQERTRRFRAVRGSPSRTRLSRVRISSTSSTPPTRAIRATISIWWATWTRPSISAARSALQ